MDHTSFCILMSKQHERLDNNYYLCEDCVLTEATSRGGGNGRAGCCEGGGSNGRGFTAAPSTIEEMAWIVLGGGWRAGQGRATAGLERKRVKRARLAKSCAQSVSRSLSRSSKRSKASSRSTAASCKGTTYMHSHQSLCPFVLPGTE